MKNITRTIVRQIISAQQIKMVEGKMEVEELIPIITTKKLSQVAVEKHYKKILGDGDYSILITGREEMKNIDAMPVELFMEYATETTETELEIEEETDSENLDQE